MKWRIHPVHIMLVHFPVALLSADLGFGAAGYFLSHEPLMQAGWYCLLAGVAAGWLAILSGMTDFFLYILRVNTKEAIRYGLLHASLQTSVVLGFTVILAWEYHHRALVLKPPVWIWIAKATLVAVMLLGNYFGGELLFRYVAGQFRHDTEEK